MYYNITFLVLRSAIIQMYKFGGKKHDESLSAKGHNWNTTVKKVIARRNSPLPFLQNKGNWLETWYSELLMESSCYL